MEFLFSAQTVLGTNLSGTPVKRGVSYMEMELADCNVPDSQVKAQEKEARAR